MPFFFPCTELFTGVGNADATMDAPVSVTISSKKVTLKTRTVGGYTFSHFGDEPDRISAKGSVILRPGMEGLGFLSLLTLKTLYRLDKKKIKNILGGISKFVALGAIAASEIGDLYGQKLALASAGSGNVGATVGVTAEVAMMGIGTAVAISNAQQYMAQNPNLAVTYIYHDNYIYRGFFEDFSYTRDANNPRFINYSFNFTVDWSTENYFADFLSTAKSGSIVSAFGG